MLRIIYTSRSTLIKFITLRFHVKKEGFALPLYLININREEKGAPGDSFRKGKKKPQFIKWTELSAVSRKGQPCPSFSTVPGSIYRHNTILTKQEFLASDSSKPQSLGSFCKDSLPHTPMFKTGTVASNLT